MSRRWLLFWVTLAACFARPGFGQCSFPSQLGGYLEGGQVVPPVQVAWRGLAILNLCSDRLSGTVELTTVETITAVHLHGPALPGETAPSIRDLALPTGGVVALDVTINETEWSMIQGLHTYLDVHTTEHPDGAVRGWVVGEIEVTPAPWSIVKQMYR